MTMEFPPRRLAVSAAGGRVSSSSRVGKVLGPLETSGWASSFFPAHGTSRASRSAASSWRPRNSGWGRSLDQAVRTPGAVAGGLGGGELSPALARASSHGSCVSGSSDVGIEIGHHHVPDCRVRAAKLKRALSLRGVGSASTHDGPRISSKSEFEIRLVGLGPLPLRGTNGNDFHCPLSSTSTSEKLRRTSTTLNTQRASPRHRPRSAG
jgi:hypothetical protein